MEDNISLKIEILKQEVLMSLQQSDLPISVIYYLMSDITKELKEKYENYSLQIIEQYNKTIEEEKAKEEINKKVHEEIKNNKDLTIEDYQGE